MFPLVTFPPNRLFLLSKCIIRKAEDKNQARGAGTIFYKKPKSSDEALASRQSNLAFDEPINIQYTSGTKGFPNGLPMTVTGKIRKTEARAEYCGIGLGGFSEDKTA